MRLKHLAIRNCSRVSDIDIDIRGNLVLIGPNGSGKTTVLLCLDMLLGMNEERLGSLLTPDLVRDAARPMVVEVVFADLSVREQAVFAGKIDAGEGVLPIRLEARVGGDGVVAFARSFPTRSSQGGPTEAQRVVLGWSVLQAQTGSGIASPAAAPAPDLAFDGARARFVATIYERLHEGANVLAIDEPEAHLHPSSQRSLAKMLKTSDCQKVLVTHSPTIAGSFEPDEIVVIRSDGCAVQPRAGFLEGDAGMLARWWIGKQLEPLTAGSVIAVEGPSDRIIVDRVASAIGFDLDRNDVVLVETSGCGDMKVIESIFGSGGFDIPLYELIDQDAADDAADRLGVAEGALEGRSVFVSARDLEDEYVQAIGAQRLWDRFKEARTFSRTVLGLCETGPDGYPTEAALAQFIREKSKRKIPAALVAASLIDSSNARRVRSVARLLEAASTKR